MPKKGTTKKEAYALLRGMKDILPNDQRYWDFIMQRVQLFARNYGFNRIETPILEPASLFTRSVGTDTDIVSKEMYAFVDQGNEKIALRPEGTAGVVRSYIEHGMFNQTQPVKMFYFSPMFRHDRPQAGRQRQFWQFGFETIGDQNPVMDAQLIHVSYKFFAELGLPIQVDINSVGCPNCRPGYIKALATYLKGVKKSLCEDCQVRMTKNPLRVLDCKEKGCQEALVDAPQIIDHLCQECKDHFVQVLEYLDELEVNYNLNSKIVRGLDYYSKTAWELFEVGKDGQQDALGGGGRYDGLVQQLGGRPTPAVGFACGIERAIARLKSNDIAVTPVAAPQLYLAQLGLEARKKCLSLYETLLGKGYTVAESFSKASLKDQLEQANKLQVKYSLIIGQKEMVDDTVLIRDMESGNQEVVDFKKIQDYMAKLLRSEVKNGRVED